MERIYRIYNTKTNKSYDYFNAPNDELVAVFLENSKKVRRYNKTYLSDVIAVEMVEETSDVNKCLASYNWPQLSRVKYADSCFKDCSNKKLDKLMNHVVDWLVDAFCNLSYTFEIGLYEDYIYTIVSEKNKVIELYKFRSKNPFERTFI